MADQEKRRVTIVWTKPNKWGEIIWRLVVKGRTIYWGFCSRMSATSLPHLRRFFEREMRGPKRRKP